MVYNHQYFRKSVERELKNLDSRQMLLIKDYIDSVDELINEKDDYIKSIENKKLSYYQYLLEISIHLSSVAFGGIWLNVYLNNIIDFKTIIISLFYLVIIISKYKYVGFDS